MPTPLRSILLRFREETDDAGDDEDVLRGQLSAATQVGADIWLASDESNSVERLSPVEAGVYGAHRTFRLAELLRLPGGDDEEIDIEGMDVDGGYLWIIGSHGLKRRKPKDGMGAARGIARLAELRADGNRYLLARVPIEHDGEDGWVLRESAASADAEGGERTAARLMGSDRGNLLMDALRMDEHVAPFLGIPGKDNGLDIEGIAVRGKKVFLGLRGPVLRGWAVVLELRIEDEAPGLLRLGTPKGATRPYRKHFLDLRGLGVRDLAFHGDRLLVLAGPTMDLDGPAAVYRWRDPLDADDDTLVARDALEEVVAVPYGTGEGDAHDHPEGLALFSEDGGAEELLVVYDSPDARRQDGEAAVRADVFALE